MSTSNSNSSSSAYSNEGDLLKFTSSNVQSSNSLNLEEKELTSTYSNLPKPTYLTPQSKLEKNEKKEEEGLL